MTSNRVHTTGARALTAVVVVIAAGTLLAACGGGSSGGDNQTAGIEGTGIVSGFGSVYINGIEFASNNARVEINGESANEARLRVGDVVTVSGRIDGDRASADVIRFERALKAPISRIDLASDGGGELAALGQTIRFDADTTFFNTTADALAPDDLVAVSGFADDNGGLQATSITRADDDQPGATRLDIQGTVRDLQADQFRLGGLIVRYAGARIDARAGALASGATVQVFGTRSESAASSVPLNADAVIVRTRKLGDDGERVFVQGAIAEFNGPGDFVIAGQRIDAQQARRTDETGLELASGTLVSVRGKRTGDSAEGAIIATTVEVEPPPAYTLHARIAAVDAGANTVEVLNTSWNVRADTLYLDSRSGAGNDRRLRIGGLAPGDTVSVNGYVAGNGRIMSRLERVPADATGDARVRGAISSFTRDTGRARLSIAGVGVVTRDGVTEFIDANGEPITAAAFFALTADGSRIDARGPANSGRIDTARVVQLLD